MGLQHAVLGTEVATAKGAMTNETLSEFLARLPLVGHFIVVLLVIGLFDITLLVITLLVFDFFVFDFFVFDLLGVVLLGLSEIATGLSGCHRGVICRRGLRERSEGETIERRLNAEKGRSGSIGSK